MATWIDKATPLIRQVYTPGVQRVYEASIIIIAEERIERALDLAWTGFGSSINIFMKKMATPYFLED